MGLVYSGVTLAQTELLPLLPPYWIAGAVGDIPAAKADGRYVDFYRSDADLAAGRYAQGIIAGNRVFLNAFAIFPAALLVGETYKVVTERRSDDYGAKATVTISGKGWDEIKDFALVKGGGIAPPTLDPGGKARVVEPPPEVKIWFGNRLYQKALVEKGEKFVISSKPEVKIDVAITAPYSLAQNIEAYALVLDAGETTAKNLTLTASHVTAKAYAAGSAPEEGKLSSMNIKYSITEPLSEGKHTFTVTSLSSGKVGVASLRTETASVEVMGGPLRLIGPPLTYPSPFSITKQKTVIIQYGLSADANIDIFILGLGGVRAKKFSLMAGGEGGSAGINKVTWDGMTDMGTFAGNAIWLVTLVSRDDGRLLGKAKLTIVD
jgi:hypothetical protein